MPTIRTILVCSLLFIGIAGCPKPPPAPKPPDALGDAAPSAPACPTDTSETPEGVCDALFTADGHACVVCQGGAGCIDHSTEIYCVTGGACTADHSCMHTATDMDAPKTMSAKRRIQSKKVSK
jgi:hypothetical protein